MRNSAPKHWRTSKDVDETAAFLKKITSAVVSKHNVGGRAKKGVRPITLPKLTCLQDKED